MHVHVLHVCNMHVGDMDKEAHVRPYWASTHAPTSLSSAETVAL